MPDPPERGYHGPPEKQRNKGTPNLYKGKPENSPNQDSQSATTSKELQSKPATTTTQQQKSKAPPHINKPTGLHDASSQPIATASPFSTSAFVHNVVERELHQHETFSPAAPNLTQITRDIYSQLVIDKPEIARRFTPEHIDYYGACMLWLRIISLKQRLQQELTPEEVTLHEMLQLESFSLPEPLRLQLLVLGRAKTALGTTLRPTFPPLPTTRIVWENTNIPGNYGPAINAANHNLYEEIPCIGIHVSALVKAQMPAIGALQPPGLPPGASATYNLLGYRPTKNYRPEATASLVDSGITIGEVQCHPRNTGFNFDLLKNISEILATTSTFKTTSVSIQNMSEFGTTSQIASYMPEIAEGVRNTTGLVTIQTINEESHTQIGVSLVFAPRYFKQSEPGDFAPWSCAVNSGVPPAAQPVTVEWFNNRNVRRNIRDIYSLPQFASISTDAREYLRVTIESLMIANR